LLLFVKHLAGVDIGALEWACDQAAKRCRFFPVPAELRDFASQAPRKVLPPIERPMLPDATYYEDGSKRLQEIIDSLVDDWGPPTTRHGRA
jgi:hypothetical protein